MSPEAGYLYKDTLKQSGPPPPQHRAVEGHQGQSDRPEPDWTGLTYEEEINCLH